MGQKSVKVLQKLKEEIIRGDLPVKEFPQKSVCELIHAENQLWMAQLSATMQSYVKLCSQFITIAMQMEEKEMIKVMEELIDHMEKKPLELLDFIIEQNGLEKMTGRVDGLVRQYYEQIVRKIYQKYPFHSKTGVNVFQGKGVVYTVITGDYDSLKEPLCVNDNYDYICFSDNKNLKSDIWLFRYLDNEEGLDNIRLARKYKILCHEVLKEYDYSIYVDGKIQIIGELEEMVSRYSKGSPMLAFPHYERVCAYDEAKMCIAWMKDDPKIIEEQMEGYEKAGYPKQNGMIDSACLVRKHHNIELQNVMMCWWNEVKNKSRRDQLSIGYVCWKNDFHYDITDLFIYDNDYIYSVEHRNMEK